MTDSFDTRCIISLDCMSVHLMCAYAAIIDCITRKGSFHKSERSETKETVKDEDLISFFSRSRFVNFKPKLTVTIHCPSIII